MRETIVVSEGTMKPEDVIPAACDALRTIGADADANSIIADWEVDSADGDPDGIGADGAYAAIEETAEEYGYTFTTAEGDGACYLLRPIFTAQEVAAEILRHVTRKYSDDGEPFVRLIRYDDGGHTEPEWVRTAWDAMVSGDWGGYRAASEDAHSVLVAVGIDGSDAEEMCEDGAFKMAEGRFWDISELLLWYRNGGSDSDESVAMAWEDMVRPGAADIEGDPIRHILAVARFEAAYRNHQYAARALLDTVEELNE